MAATKEHSFRRAGAAAATKPSAKCRSEVGNETPFSDLGPPARSRKLPFHSFPSPLQAFPRSSGVGARRWQEGLLARIELQGVPVGVIRTFVECTYGGHLSPDISSAHAESLLTLGDMHQVLSLAEACCAFLHWSVNTDTVISVLRCFGKLQRKTVSCNGWNVIVW